MTAHMTTPEEAAHLLNRLVLSVGQYSVAGLKAQNEDAIGTRVPDGNLLATKGAVAVIADGVSAAEAGRAGAAFDEAALAADAALVGEGTLTAADAVGEAAPPLADGCAAVDELADDDAPEDEAVEDGRETVLGAETRLGLAVGVECPVLDTGTLEVGTLATGALAAGADACGTDACGTDTAEVDAFESVAATPCASPVAPVIGMSVPQ